MPTASVGDLVEGLRACIAHVEGASAAVAAALQTAADFIQQCQALELEASAERTAAVANQARSLAASLARTSDELAAILAVAEALRDGSNDNEAGQATNPRPDGRPSAARETSGAGGPPRTPAPSVSGWHQRAVVPPWVQRVGAGYASRPEGTNRPTVGRFTSSGSGVDTALESGGRERSIAADLRHDPLRGPPVTFYQHVEAKAAGIMRRDGLSDAELVLDNTVCGSTDRDRDQPWACHAILPSILPAGARLSVWVTRDGGRTWWQTVYRGTGERIQP